MRGTCESCGRIYDTEQLAGYNVRMGHVTSAMCHGCLAILSPSGVTGGDWLDVLIKRVRAKRRRAETAGRIWEASPWEQMTMQDHG